jgi:hypothetical protein
MDSCSRHLPLSSQLVNFETKTVPTHLYQTWFDYWF